MASFLECCGHCIHIGTDGCPYDEINPDDSICEWFEGNEFSEDNSDE